MFSDRRERHMMHPIIILVSPLLAWAMAARRGDKVIISVRRFAPPGIAASASGKVRARASRRFQTSIRIALSPHCSAVFLQSFPNTPSLAQSLSRSVSQSHHALSTPPAWTHSESSFVGLTAAENYSGTVGLKPESSISHSRVDALECLRQRLFPLSLLDWLRPPSLLLSPRCRTITTITTMPRR
jgi:hypothetical protein